MRPGLWLLLAQASSSASNLALTALVARGASEREFAAFALVLPAYVVLQQLLRVYLLIPRQIFSHGPNGRENPAGHPGAAAVLIGLVGMGCLVLVGCAFNNYWALLLGLGMPGLLAYDCLRNEVLVHRRWASVAGLDGAWLALQGVMSAALSAIHAESYWHMASWCAPPALIAAAGALAWPTNRWPLTGGLDYLWAARRKAPDGVTELISSVLVVQAIPYLVLGIAGLEVAGAFRAGQILLGPINVAVMSLTPPLQMAVAGAAFNRRRSVDLIRRQTLVLCSICAAYGLVLIALPDRLGTELLGATWPTASVLLPGLALHGIARVPFMTLVTAMRSVGMQRLLVRQRLIGATLLVVGACLGSLAPNPVAIPLGMATGAVISATWAALAMSRQKWPEKGVLDGSVARAT
jgi:O-antigen/teichoic acid export membrane protein